jgi:hypothetical protein
MTGSIRIVSRYTRLMIRRNPTILFVFGDNLARVGLGGQAAEARGEPNSVGIPTKSSPSVYFSDDMFDNARPAVVQAFNRLAMHLVSGGTIVWPADGVGTGLARLEEMAPEIHAGIERCREFLFTLGTISE